MGTIFRASEWSVIAEIYIIELVLNQICVLQIRKCQCCQVAINLKVKLESYSKSRREDKTRLSLGGSAGSLVTADAADVMKRRSEF